MEGAAWVSDLMTSGVAFLQLGCMPGPLTCMIRMHIPTVPRTCLLSSNHIFTFS